MNAEIIAVGSELLTPQRLDTNSLFLTAQLNELGVEVVTKMVIGDDRDRLCAAIRGALSRSEILVLTGGLGPTEDDVTRDAVAQALGRPLVFRQELWDAVQTRFRRGNWKMAENNRRQAYLIEGAEALPNVNGTAPGQWVETGGRAIVLLPGPPHELEALYLAECRARLERLLPQQVIRTLVLRVAGMGESDLDHRIAPVYTRYTNPVTTILAAASDIQIHLRARCGTEDEAENLLAEVAAQIDEILGDRVYSRNGEPLETVVGEQLRRRGETLAVAESCTGGMLAGRITSIPGSSEYFAGGFLVYNDRMKETLLGVPALLLAEFGAVSAQAAEAMAAGARERTGASWAVSVTGVAGPGGGSDAAPVGTIFYGIGGLDGVRTHHSRFLGDRARIRTLATQTALDLLRRRLA